MCFCRIACFYKSLKANAQRFYQLLHSHVKYSIQRVLMFLLGKEQDLDVIFIVGSSNLQSFLEYRDLILTTLKSPQATRTKYAVITYSSSPTVFLGLKDFVSKQDLVDRLRNVPWQGPGSDLDGALRKADEVFSNEGRLEARKVLVVYGDGPFSVGVDDLEIVREIFYGKDVKVITVTGTDDEESRKKLDEVTTTDEGSVITDPGKPEESADDINERILTGMLRQLSLFSNPSPILSISIIYSSADSEKHLVP